MIVKQYWFKDYPQKNLTKVRQGFSIESPNKEFYGGFPIQQITANSDVPIKVAAIAGPLYRDQIQKYHDLRKDGYIVLGISSYGYWPQYNPEDNKEDGRSIEIYQEYNKEMIQEIDGWLYTSQNADILPPFAPRLLYSESDSPYKSIQIKDNLPKKWDLIYSCGGPDDWHSYHKNWKLATKCFKNLIAQEKNIQILVIGRKPNSFGNLNSSNIEYREFIPYYDFLDLIQQSRISFFPAQSDASPRVITESFVKNTPVLLYERIFGGWKYINNQTGMFFSDENDFVKKVQMMLKIQYKTRQWMYDNYLDNLKSDLELEEFVENIMQNKLKKNDL